MATWGVIAPGWLRSDVDMEPDGFAGLWFGCQSGYSDCVKIDLTDLDDSTYATLGLSCVGLLFLLASCLIVIRGNWCVTVESLSRSAEVLAYLAGLSLFIGCMVFVGDNVDFIQDFPGIHFGPSFILTVSASVTSGLAGILLSTFGACSARYVRFSSTAPTIGPTTRLSNPVQYPVGYQVHQIPQNVYYGSNEGHVVYTPSQNQSLLTTKGW